MWDLKKAAKLAFSRVAVMAEMMAILMGASMVEMRAVKLVLIQAVW